MEPSRADVAIVGAGLIGTSIAWRLSQAGTQVTLFDAGRVGGEASSAGAGMLSPGGEFDRPSVWLDLGLEGLRLYPTFIDELRARDEPGDRLPHLRGCATRRQRRGTSAGS
jgi:glycine oxidase